MDNLTKAIQIIGNYFTILGKKIDTLSSDLKKQKPIVVNVPEVKVPEAKVTVTMPEIVMPEFPAYPEFPEVKLPPITVNVPEIKLPTINVPETVVNIPAPIVNVPAPIVNIEPTPVNFPNEMKVIGMQELIDGVNKEVEPVKLLDGISNTNPIPVQMVDSKGRVLSANDFGGGGGGPSTVAIRVGTTAVSSTNPMPVTTDGFAIPMFDQQVIDESAAPATTIITYKLSGTTVATKTITVSGTTTTITVSIV